MLVTVPFTILDSSCGGRAGQGSPQLDRRLGEVLLKLMVGPVLVACRAGAVRKSCG